MRPTPPLPFGSQGFRCEIRRPSRWNLTLILRTIGMVCVSWMMGITAYAQDPIASGENVSGTLRPDERLDWTFEANSGDRVIVRVGTTTTRPRIELYGPGDDLVAEGTGVNSTSRDARINHEIATSGPFRISLLGNSASDSFDYTLHFLRIPDEATFVSDDDEGGPLVNGSIHPGDIPLGDIDFWQFEGTAGQHITLRVGAGGMRPLLELYGPEGQFIAEHSGPNSTARDAFLAETLDSAGLYTAVVSSADTGGQSQYSLHFVQAPGELIISEEDEGGPLTNGGVHQGVITLGDLDAWQFSGDEGDSVVLRVGASDTRPYLQLIGPDGSLIEESSGPNSTARDSFISTSLENSGVYTAIVSGFSSGDVFDYQLHFIKAPGEFTVPEGDEGGPLTNGGGPHNGSIDVGDLDIWSFEGNEGDSLLLRVGATGTRPSLQLFGPDGGLIGQASGPNSTARDALISATLEFSGSYTVVVSGHSSGDQFDYQLHYVTAPGEYTIPDEDEGGPLSNGGVPHMGSIGIGDVDVWQFEGSEGDYAVVRVGADGTRPLLQIYGPNGELVGEGSGTNSTSRDASVSVPLEMSGSYTAVLTGNSSGDTFAYQLHYLKSPDVIFSVPDGEEGGELDRGVTNGEITLGDLDAWQFQAEEGEAFVIRVTASDSRPALTVYGPSGGVVVLDSGTNSTSTDAEVFFTADNGGLYTLLLDGHSTGSVFTYELEFIPFAPDLNIPEIVPIPEEELLTLSLSSSAPSVPGSEIDFEFVSGPEGMTLERLGASDAVISWTPSEAQGPGEHQVIVSATDLVDGVPYTRTREFTLTVEEVNSPPSLAVSVNQAIYVGSPIVITLMPSDDDLPANLLTIDLVESPEGMVLDSERGVLEWTPTEAQTSMVEVRVTDDGVPPIQTTVTFALEVVEMPAIDVRILGPGQIAISVDTDIPIPVVIETSIDLIEWETVESFDSILADEPIPLNLLPEDTIRFYRIRPGLAEE